MPASRSGRTGYRILVERALGQDVRTWCSERLRRGESWRAIAREMSQLLDLPPDAEISRTLLQKWFRDDVPPA